MKSFPSHNPRAQCRALAECIRSAGLAVLAAALLAGCAYTPPPVAIAPVLPAELAAIERDTALALSVSDARGDGDDEVIEAVEAAVRELFARKGYRLVAAGAPHDARLSVAVRVFDYAVATKRWSSDEEAAAVFVAEAVRGASRRTSTYRSVGERQAVLELNRPKPGAHPYTVEREVKAVGFVVVSSDRGLCGGLNVNLFRQAVAAMSEWHDKGADVRVSVIGKKAGAFFNRFKANIVSEAVNLGDAPQLHELVGAVKVMMDDYMEGRIDRLFVASNEFVNTMTQRPLIEQLIPITPNAEDEDKDMSHHWDYIYEPDAKEVIDTLMSRYIESLIYQEVAENAACEQAARMVAMKSATDNAGKLIDELQLVYNKARQAAITQELSEIVGGAAAVYGSGNYCRFWRRLCWEPFLLFWRIMTGLTKRSGKFASPRKLHINPTGVSLLRDTTPLGLFCISKTADDSSVGRKYGRQNPTVGIFCLNRPHGFEATATGMQTLSS